MKSTLTLLGAGGLCLALLGGCNMSRHRYDLTVNGPEQSADLHVWVDDENGFTEHALFFDTLLFPIDALWSLGASTVAMFDDTWEDKYGPLGTFLALFPCITTVNVTGPGKQRWDSSINPPKVDFEGTLDRNRYEDFMRSVELGKGPPALQRLSIDGLLRAGPASNPNRVDRLDLVGTHRR